jgi:hypothetical protein
MIKRNYLTFGLIAMLAWLLTACQSHLTQVFPTSPPNGHQQILVTFKQENFIPGLPGGSLRAYGGGANWSSPLHLAQQIRELETTFALREQKTWLMESVGKYCVVFMVAEERDIQSLLRDLQQVSNVQTVQVMNEFVVMSSTRRPANKQFYNDTYLQLQYGEFVEQLTSLHQYSRGRSVKVGVIDTLSDLNHPDLRGQVSRQYRYVQNPFQRDTHGTAVVGIISALANNGTGLVGLAPEADLFVYGACETLGEGRARCSTYNILQGLEQAIKDKVQVLNLSIAGPYDSLVEEVVNAVIAQGIVVVAASNNESRHLSFPATMEKVIGVDEVPAAIAGQNLSFSEQFGDWLARSEKLSTLNGGGYQFFYGSSISSASASGIAALFRSHSSYQDTLSFVEALVTGDCEVLYQQKFAQQSDLLRKSTTCKQPVVMSDLKP